MPATWQLLIAFFSVVSYSDWSTVVIRPRSSLFSVGLLFFLSFPFLSFGGWEGGGVGAFLLHRI